MRGCEVAERLIKWQSKWAEVWLYSRLQHQSRSQLGGDSKPTMTLSAASHPTNACQTPDHNRIAQRTHSQDFAPTVCIPLMRTVFPASCSTQS